MGGLGHLFGGLAQGLGQGLVDKAKFDMADQAEARRAEAQARREAALEGLRHTNRKDETAHAGEVAIKTETGKLTAAEPFKAADDERIRKREEERDTRQHKNRLSEIGAEGTKQERLTRLSSSLSAGNTAAEIRLRKQLEDNDIRDTFEGQDGMVYVITKSGKTQSTGVKYNPNAKVRTSDDDTYGAGPVAPPSASFVRDPKTGKIVPAR